MRQDTIGETRRGYPTSCLTYIEPFHITSLQHIGVIGVPVRVLGSFLMETLSFFQ